MTSNRQIYWSMGFIAAWSAQIGLFIIFYMFPQYAASRDLHHSMIKKDKIIERDSLECVGPLSEENKQSQHELIIALEQNNINLLEQILLERSTPGSHLYQQWLTFDEVGEYITNHEAERTVTEWIESLGDGQDSKASIVWISPRKEYMRVKAPIKTWEKALDTRFYMWKDHTFIEQSKGFTKPRNEDLYTHILSKEYSLPSHMNEHIFAILNIIQAPPVQYNSYIYRDESGESTVTGDPNHNITNNIGGQAITSEAVTVQFLREYYNITNEYGLSSLTQSVFQTNSQFYSANDLKSFQSYFNLSSNVAINYNGFVIESFKNYACKNPYTTYSSNVIQVDCYEGNLDLQYIQGIAQDVSTINWYVSALTSTHPFLLWLLQISSMTSPPSVNSMSWTSQEKYMDAATMTSFNTEALKLNLIGVTIVVSSGDDGVANRDASTQTCQCSASTITRSEWTGSNTWNGQGYFPNFPNTSPYVISIGATNGPNKGLDEVACSSDTGGVITSGGGFSTFFSQPSWQKRAVQSYFNKTISRPPLAGYNSLGRAYPDVSLIGVKYPIVTNGAFVYVYGTSASAPVFAGFLSLLNSVRKLQNKGTLGFINPTLYSGGYKNQSKYFQDILTGGNNCCSQTSSSISPTCCNSGFNSTKGWDPVTGWGSIKYSSLMTLVSDFGFIIGQPTPRPTRFPTTRPSMRPTAGSTLSPTAPAFTSDVYLSTAIWAIIGASGGAFMLVLFALSCLCYKKFAGKKLNASRLPLDSINPDAVVTTTGTPENEPAMDGTYPANEVAEYNTARDAVIMI